MSGTKQTIANGRKDVLKVLRTPITWQAVVDFRKRQYNVNTEDWRIGEQLLYSKIYNHLEKGGTVELLHES